jgi:ADP-ribose pyrophosphatase
MKDIIEKNINKIKIPTIKSKEIVYRWWHSAMEKIEATLHNGNQLVRYREICTQSIIVVPFLDNGKLLMNLEYRFGSDKVMVEFPGGEIEYGESPECAALRELEEETGYRAQNIKLVHSFYRSSAHTTELVYIAIATELTFVGEHRDKDEDIINLEVSLSQLEKHLASSDHPVLDGITMIGYYVADRHLSLKNNE